MQKPKGTYDVNGKLGRKTIYILNLARTLMEKYNYEYWRTPLFESSELFHRGVGDRLLRHRISHGARPRKAVRSGAWHRRRGLVLRAADVYSGGHAVRRDDAQTEAREERTRDLRENTRRSFLAECVGDHGR